MEGGDPSDDTEDWESIINSVHYRSMKKLMAVVDTKSFDSFEEFSKLLEYFPALNNSFPEYHDITLAYVSAFQDKDDDEMKKGGTLPPILLNKTLMIQSLVSKLRKASEIEPRLVKLHAAKIIPTDCAAEPKRIRSFSEIEKIADIFCVESCKAARIRRLKQTFPGKKIVRSQASKVAPCLFRSKTRKTSITSVDHLDRIAAMFCVENEEEAYLRRRQIREAATEEVCSDSASRDRKYSVERVPRKTGCAGTLSDYVGFIQIAKSDISNKADVKNKIDTEGIVIDTESTPAEVTGNVIDKEKRKSGNENRGLVALCLNSLKKLFKKKRK